MNVAVVPAADARHDACDHVSVTVDELLVQADIPVQRRNNGIVEFVQILVNKINVLFRTAPDLKSLLRAVILWHNVRQIPIETLAHIITSRTFRPALLSAHRIAVLIAKVLGLKIEGFEQREIAAAFFGNVLGFS